MACMCGDIACPSCGPAQGHDPDFETVCEYVQEVILAGLLDSDDIETLADDIAERLGKDQGVADALLAAASKWHRDGHQSGLAEKLSEEMYDKHRESRRRADQGIGESVRANLKGHKSTTPP